MKQYKRLLWAMRSAACLSQTEAECALRNWVSNRDIWSGEAANHYGGFLQLVRGARQSHSYRAARGLETLGGSKVRDVQDALTGLFTGGSK